MHLLLLEVNPPRRQVVARELPSCGELREVCEGFASPSQGKKPHSGSEEVVEKDRKLE